MIGGWSVQAIGQLQSGRPISFHDRNIYFNGDLGALKADYSGDSNDPVFDVSGFYFHDAAVQTNGVDDPTKQRADSRIRLASNIRYFPSRVDGLRGQGLHLWDISIVKQVPLSGRVRAQFNVEFLNAFNHPIYNNPNTDPDVGQLRHRDEPEQPPARHPVRREDRVLKAVVSRCRVPPDPASGTFSSLPPRGS